VGRRGERLAKQRARMMKPASRVLRIPNGIELSGMVSGLSVIEVWGRTWELMVSLLDVKVEECGNPSEHSNTRSTHVSNKLKIDERYAQLSHENDYPQRNTLDPPQVDISHNKQRYRRKPKVRQSPQHTLHMHHMSYVYRVTRAHCRIHRTVEIISDSHPEPAYWFTPKNIKYDHQQPTQDICRCKSPHYVLLPLACCVSRYLCGCCDFEERRTGDGEDAGVEPGL
jgi:hypothetical protein